MRSKPDPLEIARDLDESAASAMQHMIESLKEHKPNDRSARDRAYAVTITQLEQAFAYFSMYAIAMPTALAQQPQFEPE